MNLKPWKPHLTPNLGTILAVLTLLLVQHFVEVAQAERAPIEFPSSSTDLFPYQGRLNDLAGNPVNGAVNMEFRFYSVPTEGTHLWEEFWTDPNAVQVTNGLFNVLLGSRTPGLGNAIGGYEDLYLGITINTDAEMSPRIQMGSVPFALQALTVPDGAITPAKAPFALIAPGYSMEVGTTILTTDEQGYGYNFKTKHITFSTPFNGSCPVVVMTNTSQGWGAWGDRINSMAAIPTTTGFNAAVFRSDGAAIGNNPYVEWVAYGCR